MEHHNKERITALTLFFGALLIHFFVITTYIETTEEYEIAMLIFSSLTIVVGVAGKSMIKGYRFHKRSTNSPAIGEIEIRYIRIYGLSIPNYSHFKEVYL